MRGAGGSFLPMSTHAARPADQAGLSDAWLNHPVRQAVMTWMIFDEVFMPPSGTAARTSRMPLR